MTDSSNSLPNDKKGIQSYICSFEITVVSNSLSYLVTSSHYGRVSMGLTVSPKTAKNLAFRHKNERILTVSRKKMFTVKKSNHEIRSRDLLLSLMC